MNYKMIKNLEKIGEITYNNEDGEIKFTPEKLGAVIANIEKNNYQVTECRKSEDLKTTIVKFEVI